MMIKNCLEVLLSKTKLHFVKKTFSRMSLFNVLNHYKPMNKNNDDYVGNLLTKYTVIANCSYWLNRRIVGKPRARFK